MPVRMNSNVGKFAAALKAGESMLLNRLGDEVLEQIDRGFQQGEDALGRQWQPISADTIARKGHSRILIETGDMRDSIEADLEVAQGELLIKSDDPKLPYHEFGLPERNLPARPVLRPAAIWANQRLIPSLLRWKGTVVKAAL